MEPTGIHFILTYTCTYECDHCFLYCSPRSRGTFSLSQIKTVLEEIRKTESIGSVSFEGGEPLLTYPVLLEAIKLSAGQGLRTAIETNSFWATCEENAALWLKPLVDNGLNLLETSDDQYHFGETDQSPASVARSAAKKLGLETQTICIDDPTASTVDNINKGEPVYQGRPKSRGRAADNLTAELPVQPASTFTECPFEDLRAPGRVHLDPFGNVFLCQGISMGNMWKTPLSDLLKSYDPDNHPICGPLLQGGPAELARRYHLDLKDDCVDACHYCTKACVALIDKFPDYIAPREVYGLGD